MRLGHARFSRWAVLQKPFGRAQTPRNTHRTKKPETHSPRQSEIRLRMDLAHEGQQFRAKKKLACRGPSTRPTALRLYETSSFLHRLQSGNLHLLQRLMQFPHNRQFDCFVCVGLFLGFCCCFWFVMTS